MKKVEKNMGKTDKIVYGDFEIIPNTPLEDVEFLILSLSMEYMLSHKAEVENEPEDVEFHSEIASEIEENLKVEIAKLSYEVLSKYLEAREQYWKNFDAFNSTQNEFSPALNCDKTPQILATHKAQFFAKNIENKKNKAL